jgi:hypothetical protein
MLQSGKRGSTWDRARLTRIQFELCSEFKQDASGPTNHQVGSEVHQTNGRKKAQPRNKRSFEPLDEIEPVTKR